MKLVLLKLILMKLLLIIVFFVVVVLYVDVVVQATSKVDLMLHLMEVEFPVVGQWGVNSNNHVRPNSVELSCGCVEVEVEFGL